MEQTALILPVNIASRVDVGRLLREADALDEFLHQAAIREPGTPVKMPKTSRLLDEFIAANKVNILLDADRQKVRDFLRHVHGTAPVMHMSFGTDPSPVFVQKLMTWMRTELHPLVLLQVGLQPSIGAGCIVRTTNKHFDLSLRQYFKKQRTLLIQKIQGVTADTTPQPTVPAAPLQKTTQSLAVHTTAPATQSSGDTIETPQQLTAAVQAVMAEAAPAQPVAATAPAPATAPTPAPQPAPQAAKPEGHS